MRYYAGAAVVMGIGWMIWRLLESLSSDALAMLVGAVFMALAMVPLIVLAVAGERRRARREDYNRQEQQPSAPVVIVLGGSNSGYRGQGWGQNVLPVPQGYNTPRQQGRIVDSYAGDGWEER